jgi:leucine dehydrogenase
MVASFTIEEVFSPNNERVVKFKDRHTNIECIIAIHSTTLGPGLGGFRILDYHSKQDALDDVIRLSQGMTYKNALANLNIGGAKAVMIGNPNIIKTPENLRLYGKFVDSLKGNYITAPDVNTDIHDMLYISESTKYVVSLPTDKGGSGDPSIMTAYGVFIGIKAAISHVYGNESLNNKKIGVEGVGKVGAALVEMLHQENARIYVTDINKNRLAAISNKFRVKIIEPKDFYDIDMDVYSPCALGATLNDNTIPRLKCKIIAGGANNQLLDYNKHGRMLFDRDITYLPDYAINAGGVINAYTELISEYSLERAKKNVEKIYDTCTSILKFSKKENTASNLIADRLAEEYLKLKK